MLIDIQLFLENKIETKYLVIAMIVSFIIGVLLAKS